MTTFRISLRIAALGALMASAAMPAYAYTLPAGDETTPFQGPRPSLRPVGFGATELAPEIALRPPLRGELPAMAVAEAEEPTAEVPEVAEAAVEAGEDTAGEMAEEVTEVAIAEEVEAKPAREPRDAFEQLFLADLESFSIDVAAVDAIRLDEAEAERLAAQGIVDYAVLRDYRLPDDRAWRQPETPAERAAREMREAIQERLASRYDLERGEAGDIERFYALAEGQAMQDYGQARPAVIQPAALQVVEARFEPPAPAAPATPKAADLRSFLNTPAGIAALSQMDAAQISALTEMLRMMEGKPTAPEPARAVEAPKKAATNMPGVPPLSFRRTATNVDSDARTVGSEDNLLLRGWQVSLENGQVSMFRDDAPASRIVVREGMIVGALGAVVAIEQSEDGVRVRFESGDEISGTTS